MEAFVLKAVEDDYPANVRTTALLLAGKLELSSKKLISRIHRLSDDDEGDVRHSANWALKKLVPKEYSRKNRLLTIRQFLISKALPFLLIFLLWFRASPETEAEIFLLAMLYFGLGVILDLYPFHLRLARKLIMVVGTAGITFYALRALRFLLPPFWNSYGDLGIFSLLKWIPAILLMTAFVLLLLIPRSKTLMEFVNEKKVFAVSFPGLKKAFSRSYKIIIIFLIAISAYLCYLVLDAYPGVHLFIEKDFSLLWTWLENLWQFLVIAYADFLQQPLLVQLGYLLLGTFILYYILWIFGYLKNELSNYVVFSVLALFILLYVTKDLQIYLEEWNSRLEFIALLIARFVDFVNSRVGAPPNPTIAEDMISLPLPFNTIIYLFVLWVLWLFLFEIGWNILEGLIRLGYSLFLVLILPGILFWIDTGSNTLLLLSLLLPLLLLGGTTIRPKYLGNWDDCKYAKQIMISAILFAFLLGLPSLFLSGAITFFSLSPIFLYGLMGIIFSLIILYEKELIHELLSFELRDLFQDYRKVLDGIMERRTDFRDMDISEKFPGIIPFSASTFVMLLVFYLIALAGAIVSIVVWSGITVLSHANLQTGLFDHTGFTLFLRFAWSNALVIAFLCAQSTWIEMNISDFIANYFGASFQRNARAKTFAFLGWLLIWLLIVFSSLSLMGKLFYYLVDLVFKSAVLPGINMWQLLFGFFGDPVILVYVVAILGGFGLKYYLDNREEAFQFLAEGKWKKLDSVIQSFRTTT